MKKIYLSPPSLTEFEIDSVVSALKSGWISSNGPEVEIFETNMCDLNDVKYAVALNSGTSALHLGLMALGVKRNDLVVVPTFTFAATAFAVNYIGAKPVFIDSETETWNIDPELLDNYLIKASKTNGLPAAIICVDLFGRPCKYEEILSVSRKFNIPLIADSAESLGALYKNKSSASLPDISITSFNGNKIITTSAGGMALTNVEALADKIRYWANQSREKSPWYEHLNVGYNYRMSNILAALGNAQLKRLAEKIRIRKSIHDRYAQNFQNSEKIFIKNDPLWATSNFWLTTVEFSKSSKQNLNETVRQALQSHDIESRPLWKPLHLQPVFNKCIKLVNGVSEDLFNRGLCLPSGDTLQLDEIDYISKLILDQI